MLPLAKVPLTSTVHSWTDSTTAGSIDLWLAGMSKCDNGDISHLLRLLESIISLGAHHTGFGLKASAQYIMCPRLIILYSGLEGVEYHHINRYS